MFDSILKFIRSKTRQEWYDSLYSLLELIRDTLRNNGEVSALLGLLAGILLVLLFKWILLITICLALMVWAVLLIARD